ncbi:hypothetical protein HS125_15215 [bacterium]|nr:hypothetical protein [bacterium]
MPAFPSRQLGLAFDLRGCPSACRHCYLGSAVAPYVPQDEMEPLTEQFRQYRRDGEEGAYFARISVASWFHEPDYAPNYRELRTLEERLSGGEAPPREYLSTWRLAREPEYAAWARSVGLETCRLSFYGVGETHNWFARRKGAYEDHLAALPRMLDAGIAPAIQVFLTRKSLPELGKLMHALEELRLPERTEALGKPFVLFLRTPMPTGDARRIEYLRPTLEEVEGCIPEPLVESSRRHRQVNELWQTEAEWCRQAAARPETFPSAHPEPEEVWFLVSGRFDVYPNMGTLEPWWKLGNLKRQSVAALVEAYETNRPMGLAVNYGVSARQLVERTGRPESRRIYDSLSDLLSLYLARWCEKS